MFLRKLFNSENKLTWVLIDFLIVIAGVYCAFLIQEYAANEKVQKEKHEIVAALKYELEFFRVQMPGRAWYSSNQVMNWRKTYNSGTYDNYSDWRFIEPQYGYQVIEHAIGVQNSDIISFELSRALQEVLTQTKRIEHIEQRITAIGFRYKTIPEAAKKGTSEYQIMWNGNYDDFDRLIRAMNDRAENLGILAEKAALALDIVNNTLEPSAKRDIEEDLIIKYVDELVNNEDQAVAAVSKTFPGFTEEEIRIMYRKAIGTYSEEEPADSIP